jgi:hypothetical protein
MSEWTGDYQIDQRTPREHDRPYMGFVASLCCVSCLITTGRIVRPVQVAHCRANYPEAGEFWRPVGMQEKPHDRRTMPLCVKCHLDGRNAQHKNRSGGEQNWWALLGVYPPDLCAALSAAFDSGGSGMTVLALFASRATALRAAR